MLAMNLSACVADGVAAAKDRGKILFRLAPAPRLVISVWIRNEGVEAKERVLFSSQYRLKKKLLHNDVLVLERWDMQSNDAIWSGCHAGYGSQADLFFERLERRLETAPN